MPSAHRSFIQLARSVTFYLSAIGAHILAGGSLVAGSHILQIFAFTLFVVVITFRGANEGPALALQVLAIQSSSHFIIGGNSNGGDARMAAAHLISGLLSYKAIQYFEIAWQIFEEVLIKFSAMQFFALPQFPKTKSFIVPTLKQHFQLEYLTTSLKFRGPPNARSIC